MSDSFQAGFLTGVIEGFYGRQWSQSTRLAYADHLVALGLNTYIYAPKGDIYLRRRWQEPWPMQAAQQLGVLASHYRSRGLLFGVGLSPFELYRNYGPEQRLQLRQKVEEIAGLGPSLLSILFDDMPGELESLAERQAEIVSDVCRWVPELRVQVCPTYYSYDPVLEKYFGRMPNAYWLELGGALPGTVDVFWTGNKVCSEQIVEEDIRRIEGQLGRPVMLWDNYPVNDGAVRSRHLYCQPLTARDAGMREHLSGHLCNPMNQGVLSLPALVGLAELYGGAPEDGYIASVVGERAWQLVQQHMDGFQERGLDGMDEAERCELVRQFQGLPGEAAAEVAAWLRGEYTFDPACLTD